MSRSGDEDARTGRRAAVQSIALGGVALATGIGGVSAHAQLAGPSEAGGQGASTATSTAPTAPTLAAAHGLVPPTPAVERYLGPLRAGTVLDGRWTIVSVHGPRAGAVPVILEHEGSRFAVELLRRDLAGPAAVAHTETLDVFLCNRGDGGRPSQERQGLGAMALARALTARELAGAQLPGLATLDERRRAHPLGIFHVPTDATS